MQQPAAGDDIHPGWAPRRGVAGLSMGGASPRGEGVASRGPARHRTEGHNEYRVRVDSRAGLRGRGRGFPKLCPPPTGHNECRVRAADGRVPERGSGLGEPRERGRGLQRPRPCLPRVTMKVSLGWPAGGAARRNRGGARECPGP